MKNKRVDLSKVDVFWTTPEYVDYCWVASKSLPAELRTKLRKVFLPEAHQHLPQVILRAVVPRTLFGNALKIGCRLVDLLGAEEQRADDILIIQIVGPQLQPGARMYQGLIELSQFLVQLT